MAGKKQVFDPAKHCGGKRKRGPCKNPLGFRTPHKGAGRCWLCGGLVPIKHGFYSTVANESLRTKIEAAEQLKDKLNLEPEVDMVRGLVADYIERHAAIQEALLAWHKTFDGAFTAFLSAPSPADIVKTLPALRSTTLARPRMLPDLAAASIISDRLRKLIETIHEMKQRNSIPAEVVANRDREMARVLMKYVPENIVRSVIQEWREIRLSTNTRD